LEDIDSRWLESEIKGGDRKRGGKKSGWDWSRINYDYHSRDSTASADERKKITRRRSGGE